MTKQIQRAQQHLESQLQSKEEQFKAVCQRIALDFSREGGPSWEHSSDEALWRELRTEIRVLKDTMEVLYDVFNPKG